MNTIAPCPFEAAMAFLDFMLYGMGIALGILFISYIYSRITGR
jgi:hypothetical protein